MGLLPPYYVGLGSITNFFFFFLLESRTYNFFYINFVIEGVPNFVIKGIPNMD